MHKREEDDNGTTEVYDSGLHERYRIPEGERAKISRQISEIFGPIFKVMRLTGGYFGETTLTGSRLPRKFYISFYYCLIIELGQWLLALIGVISHFYEGFSSMTTFLFLFVTTIWYVQCACSFTFCLLTLPLTQKKQSRFAQFIAGLVKSKTVLDGLKQKALKELTIAILVSFINSLVIGLLAFHYSGVISIFKPWNRHLAIRIIEIFFGILNSFAWNFPVLVFCVTCLVLEKIFDSLKRKVPLLTIAQLRQEHLRLCELVELANRVFSLLMFVIISLDIPLICINVYQLIKSTKSWSKDTDVIVVISYLYWSVWTFCLIAVLCTFGNKVNKKVGSYMVSVVWIWGRGVQLSRFQTFVLLCFPLLFGFRSLVVPMCDIVLRIYLRDSSSSGNFITVSEPAGLGDSPHTNVWTQIIIDHIIYKEILPAKF